MSVEWPVYACLGLGLACALVGGVFQSFSDFVMRGLNAAQPAGGIDVMQQINRTVFRSVFLVLMLGLAPVLLGFAIYAGVSLPASMRLWIIAGAVIYLASVFLVTMLGNVPMNNRLDGMAYGHADTVAYWRTYGEVWTNWNHFRTIGSIAAAVCCLMAAAQAV